MARISIRLNVQIVANISQDVKPVITVGVANSVMKNTDFEMVNATIQMELLSRLKSLR